MSAQDQVGHGFRKPDLLKISLLMAEKVGLDELERSFPTQIILRHYNFMIEYVINNVSTNFQQQRQKTGNIK